MNRSKVLADLVSSASFAKTHYDVWWAQMNEAKPLFASTMNSHRDFFLASQDAHYTAFFIHLAKIFDKRSDSSSLATYLELICDHIEPTQFQVIETRYTELAHRATPLITVRHKTVANVDAFLSEKDVLAPLKITWNEVRSIIYDAAALVEYLAGAPHQGAVGIPRDGRLSKATLKLLGAIK